MKQPDELDTSPHGGESPGTTTQRSIAMPVRKRIALIAHDNQKAGVLDWARYNRDTLSGHELFATGTTGGLLAKELDLPITRFLSGPLGGDQQVGAAIVEGKIGRHRSGGPVSGAVDLRCLGDGRVPESVVRERLGGRHVLVGKHRSRGARRPARGEDAMAAAIQLAYAAWWGGGERNAREQRSPGALI